MSRVRAALGAAAKVARARHWPWRPRQLAGRARHVRARPRGRRRPV